MLKVLFVSSGNSPTGLSPIVKNQAKSLSEMGVQIDFYTIVGRGIAGYLGAVAPLKKMVKNTKYDIIHAHYSLSAFTATLAGCKPMVVSLMGSDIRLGWCGVFAIKGCSKFWWNSIIVKSKEMADNVGIEKCSIIPNGIDLSIFRPTSKINSKKRLGWEPFKKHILFAANPSLEVKNYQLFQKAYQILSMQEKLEVHFLKDVPHNQVPLFMNASDIVILTSLWEGSPNVIKEAMACNCPTISTKVGDVDWLFGNQPGHFLTNFDEYDVAKTIETALSFASEAGITQGRDRVIRLGLDSGHTAKKIIQLYKSVVEESFQ